MPQMTSQNPLLDDSDTVRLNVAEIYDYLFGSKAMPRPTGGGRRRPGG
jgi:hypothetical protein